MILTRFFLRLGTFAFCVLLGCFSLGRYAPAGSSSEKVEPVKEVFRTPDFPGDEIDSLALWRDGKGGGLLYITAKKVDEIHICDAISGRLVATLGRTGKDLGKLARPNGIVVAENLLFVIERDNHRVQVFELPMHKPLLTFGEDQLELPYGLTAFAVGEAISLYVTDDYPVLGIGPSDEKENPTVNSPYPPVTREGLVRRVKRFLVRRQGSQLSVSFLGAFGDTTPAGALHVVESIQADPKNDNLFICDETTRSVKVYDLDGRFKGKSIGGGVIDADPEGLALIEDADAPSGGYLIVTDQGLQRTLFHLFSRDGARYYGAYTGDPVLANTDGIVFSPGDLGPFKGGALYAVHDDLRVQGYSWGSFGVPR
jgi:3-phytase